MRNSKKTGEPDNRTDESDRGTDADPRADALRANLLKRKQQARARRGGKGVGRSERSAFDADGPGDCATPDDLPAE